MDITTSSTGINTSIDTEVKDAFLEYETLKIQAKVIDSRLDELRPTIMNHVPLDEEVMADRGKFYLQSKTSWKYSQSVTDAVEEVDKLKAQEKADGTAEGNTTQVLIYKEITP